MEKPSIVVVEEEEAQPTPVGTVPRIEEAKEADWSDDDDETPKARGKQKKGPTRKRTGGSRTEGDLDPLVAIMMKEEVIKLCSTLMAKLELIRFDEERTTVFKTPWAEGLFHSCVKRLAPEKMSDFDIQKWYNEVIAADRVTEPGRRTRGANYAVSPALATQAIQTNWLMPLFQQELETPGFMLLLYNTLELEDQTHQKLATRAKDDAEYPWIMSGSMNQPTPLCIEGQKREGPKLIGNK